MNVQWSAKWKINYLSFLRHSFFDRAKNHPRKKVPLIIMLYAFYVFNRFFTRFSQVYSLLKYFMCGKRATKSQRHITYHALNWYSKSLKACIKHKINMFLCVHTYSHFLHTHSIQLWCRKFIKHFQSMNLLSDFLFTHFHHHRQQETEEMRGMSEWTRYSETKMTTKTTLKSVRNFILQVK